MRELDRREVAHDQQRHEQDQRQLLGEQEEQHEEPPYTRAAARAAPLTIRTKLYLAILLTVLGPMVTIAVALNGMDRLGDRFDEVQDRSRRRALALDLKFGVTDVNGWQTAWGYDDGALAAALRERGRRLPP